MSLVTKEDQVTTRYGIAQQQKPISACRSHAVTVTYRLGKTARGKAWEEIWAPYLRASARGFGTFVTPREPGRKRSPLGAHENLTAGGGGVRIKLLAAQQGKPGPYPGGVTPGILHLGIVPDYVVCGFVFSWISRFPSAAPYSPRLTLIDSQEVASSLEERQGFSRRTLDLEECGRNNSSLHKGTIPRGKYCGGVVVIPLASHLVEPGSISGGIALGFSRMGIVPDDDAVARVFLGISRFAHSCIPALLHTHLISLSSALKSSMLRTAQIYFICHCYIQCCGYLSPILFLLVV
ncbi:hypothetical protein PR048_015870 [Dryococelus australis]|uniref:Uncharacterized protein n=1 Tax=Dryococelus australis TaxID=614101 RepID=A0ABQ9HI67_9NEOP|nr:hypothetical protein PR048_015870 [Dryococelus australis]